MDSEEFLRDESLVRRVIQMWSMWRDHGRWEALRSTFTPDAIMAVTVSVGPASAYVDQCAWAAAQGGHGNVTHHLVGGSVVKVSGTRALAETALTLLLRTRLDGVEVDLTAVGRFCDRLLKNRSEWRIHRRDVLFEKDSIHPVAPADALSISPERLAEFPAHYRYTCLLVASFGLEPDMTSPSPGSPELAAFHQAGEVWLHATDGASP